MNSAERLDVVHRRIRVLLSSGVVVSFRPALAGEAAMAGVLPTDGKHKGKMTPEEVEAWKEMILDRAKPLILKCSVDPKFVDGKGDSANGYAPYSYLTDEDQIECYMAIMDGVSDMVETLNTQFPSADRSEKNIALVAQAFGKCPLELELIDLPRWIRLLRYARLCGAIKEKGKE